MDHAARRVWVVLLSAAAVLLAGLLFPATGFGTVPSPPIGGQPADGPPVANPDGGIDPSGDAATPTPTTSPSTPTASPTDSADTPKPTVPPTRTPTPTPTPSGAAGDGGGDGAAGAMVLAVLLVPLGLLGALGISMEGKRRDWPVFRRLPVPAMSIGEAGRAVTESTMRFLVGLSSSVPGLLADLGTVGSAAARAGATALSALGRGFGRAVVEIPAGLGSALVSIPSGIAGVFSGVDRSSFSGFGSGSGSDDGRGRAATGADDPEDDPPDSIEEAWAAMVEMLPVRRRGAETPAELARAAIDRGFPAEAVETITEAFRRVRYGGQSPTAAATESALAALERIERFREGDG